MAPQPAECYFSVVQSQVKADQFCFEGRNVRHVLCEGPEQMLGCSFTTAFAKWLVSWTIGSQVKLCWEANQEMIGPSLQQKGKVQE